MNLTTIVQCLDCRGTLDARDGSLSCATCGATYSVRDGIPWFAEPDPFYDQYADVHCPFSETPKGLKAAILKTIPFWSYREWRFLRDVI
ncbi:MAG: Trm112 family protein, partial [Gemmatimonadaceae bacterium]